MFSLVSNPQQRSKDFFDRIQFESPSTDSDEERRIVEVLSKREHWIGAYRKLEEKFGEFPDALVLKVAFSLEGQQAGWGAGRGSEGRIKFNLKLLGEIQRRTDENEARRKDLRDRGGNVIYRVPPPRIERIIYHELTHVLQREYEAPDWFNEGMAQLVGDDPNNLYAFAVAKKAPQDIDASGVELHDLYARGHLFWMWLESNYAVKKVVELTVFQRKPWKAALEEATGLPWSVLILSERDWSTKQLEKFKSN